MKVTDVLAIDPGLVSGWATWSDGRYEAGEDGPFPTLDGAEGWLARHAGYDGALLVVEAYIVTTETVKKSRQYWSLEQIGALKWRAHVHGVRMMDPLPKPSQAKRF